MRLRPLPRRAALLCLLAATMACDALDGSGRLSVGVDGAPPADYGFEDAFAEPSRPGPTPGSGPSAGEGGTGAGGAGLGGFGGAPSVDAEPPAPRPDRGVPTADGLPAAPDAAPPPPPDAAPPPPVDDLEFCVFETNRYRDMVGREPVVRSEAVEAFAAEGAREDHLAQSPHGHFARLGGGGVANAENACPGWLGWFVQGTVRETVAACLAMFWSEGPGGGHYENMIGGYRTVGCGWYIDAGGSITIVQDLGF